jgi:hypothetical protein
MEWRQGVQKHLVAGQGKRFLAQFPCVRRGEVYPAGRHGARRGKILKADGSGRATPGPGLRRRRCGVSAGLHPESVHLVLLVTNAQGEMVQGSAKDGVGAVVEWWDMSVPPEEHCWRAGQGVWKLRLRLLGHGGVVSSGSVFSSTQYLRKLLQKFF